MRKKTIYSVQRKTSYSNDIFAYFENEEDAETVAEIVGVALGNVAASRIEVVEHDMICSDDYEEDAVYCDDEEDDDNE